MSIIVMALGIIIILDKDIYNIVGLLIMIYSVIEILVCILFRKDINTNLNGVIEAEIVDEKKEDTKKKSTAKKTTTKKKKTTKGE